MLSKIGRYEIKEKLGEGGMAVVYLAYDPNFERSVVVKVIKRDYSDESEFRARFSREARIIAALEHEAIVPVYDFGEHDGQPFLVMRRMTGGTLADRMGGPLALGDAARIVERIADALDYAHSQGVVHRDLKPGNILFDGLGKAYLSDFGIAKLAQATTKLTGAAIIGTPAYMSPEQMRPGQSVDGRSDVYSLGVMVFELLTGRLPYDSQDMFGMMYAHVNEPPPDIRKVRPDLPYESDPFIQRAMAKKPGDRYQTTSELARELSLLATQPAKGQASLPPQPAPPSRPKAHPGDFVPTLPLGEKPAEPIQPRRFGWLWVVLPAAFMAVCALAALFGGILMLPGLLAARTPSPTTVAVVAPTTASFPTALPPSPTLAPTHTSTPVSGGKTYKDMVVGFIQTGSEGGWRAANTASFKETADRLGIKLKFYSAGNKLENQISAFRNFIADPEVNVIVLAALESTGWDEVLKEAQAAGKVVVLEDRIIDAPEDLYAAQIYLDFAEEGRKAAIEMCKLLEGSEKKNVVELVGNVGSLAARDRGQGFREKMSECGIEIIESQTANWNTTEGKEVMEVFLEKSQDIQGVFAQNDEMGLGAALAIKEARLKPGTDIKIITIDGTAGAFQAMIAGDINTVVECNPLMAPQAYEAALKALNGETLPKWIAVEDGVFYQKDAAEIFPTRTY